MIFLFFFFIFHHGSLLFLFSAHEEFIFSLLGDGVHWVAYLFFFLTSRLFCD